MLRCAKYIILYFADDNFWLVPSIGDNKVK